MQPHIESKKHYWKDVEYEPPHDKNKQTNNKMSVHLAKTQISLGIRPVWSVFAVRSMDS